MKLKKLKLKKRMIQMKTQIFKITLVISAILFAMVTTLLSFSAPIEYTQNSFIFTTQEDRTTIISTNKEEVDFTFVLSNTLNEEQEFNISVLSDRNWEVLLDEEIVTLNAMESREISFRVIVPDNLGYSRVVDSQGLVKFELDDNFFGNFNFPIQIRTEDESSFLEVVYRLEVYAPTNLPVDFTLEPSSLVVSPQFPLSLRVIGSNFDESGTQTIVDIEAFIGDERISSQEHVFSYQRNTVDILFSIPPEISPGMYDSRVVVRLDRDEGRSQSWELREVVEVLEFRDLDVSKTTSSIFLWSIDEEITVINLGNIDSVYSHSREFAWYERIFMTSNVDYDRINSEYIFSQNISPGEEVTIYISIRYGILFLVLFVVVMIYGIRTYMHYKNPLEVDIKFEGIKKVKYEGVKSFKVKIGFENIRREEIDTLRATFKMPAYLHVKDESFSITPPSKVLKGSKNYKLMWEFKRFEKGDARILGFELVNSKGILGDIHFEDLEFEVEINGKVSKYYTPIEIIRG